MNWSKVLFLNLEVDKDHLRENIPSELEIRTHNKKSYISLVFFNLEEPGIGGFNIPLALSELNIRTYVRYKSFEGIYFLTLDVNNCLLPIFINKIFKLNYHKNSVDYNTENHLKLTTENYRRAQKNTDNHRKHITQWKTKKQTNITRQKTTEHRRKQQKTMEDQRKPHKIEEI